MSILEAIRHVGEQELGSKANGNGKHTSSSVDNELRLVEKFAVEMKLFTIKLNRSIVEKLHEFESSDHIGLFQKSYSFFKSCGPAEFTQLLELYVQKPGMSTFLFRQFTKTLREEEANQNLVNHFFCMEDGCSFGIFAEKPTRGWKYWGHCRKHY